MTTSRSKIIVELISAFFIFLFAYTAISKVLEIRLFKITLSKSPLIGNLAGISAWTIILLELSAVLFLLFPPLRIKGLLLSVLLMATFTVYIAIMLLISSDLPCSCGGVFTSLSWRDHLYLNIILTALAATGLLVHKKNNTLVKLV